VTNPGSDEHKAVSMTRCCCGKDFVSPFLLDVHIYGSASATQMFWGRYQALRAIYAKAAEMAGES
jgi:hypothetical protein